MQQAGSCNVLAKKQKVTEIREFIPTSAQVSDHNQVPLENPKSKQASVKLDDLTKNFKTLVIMFKF